VDTKNSKVEIKPKLTRDQERIQKFLDDFDDDISDLKDAPSTGVSGGSVKVDAVVASKNSNNNKGGEGR